MENITAETLWDLWKHTGHGMRVVILAAFAHSVTATLCFWDNLKYSRGADRITWLLTIPIPILGPIAYFAIGLPERERQRPDNAKEDIDDWRRSLR